MLPPFLALILLAPGAHPGSATHPSAVSHPSSESRTEIRVTGKRATVELRFQALSLIEVQPDLERVQDGMLDAEELEAGRARIAAYLAEHLRFARIGAAGEEALQGELLELASQDPATVGVFDLQSLDALFAYEAPEPLGVLALESRLFHETNPWHRDLATLWWNDDAPVHHTFEGSETRWRFEPAGVRRPGVFLDFVRRGLEHVLGGHDHQAFLLLLLVAARRARSLVALVTAFTVAHALALALSAGGVVSVPPRFVELAFALALAYLGCDNLLRKGARDPWFETASFGLLHGLGFAGYLGDALRGETLEFTALAGFHVGLELGQLVAVTAGFLLAFALFRRGAGSGDPRGSGLVPPAVRVVVSGLAALAGFYWFCARAGWLPGA